MPNYSASVPMPQDDGFNAGKIGEQYGGYVGKIAGAISDVAKSDQSKSKIDEYVMAYNNPNDATIFAGLKGALRTEKLARLLQPLDPDLADTYQKKAQAEKNRETMLADNQTVVDARKGVQSTGDDDLDESKRMTAGAEALMRFNPESGMATLEKGRALADKAGNAKNLQEAKNAALESVDVATRLWQEKRDDQNLTADLYRAMSDARALGVSVKDPISDYRSEQLAGSTITTAETNAQLNEEKLALEKNKFKQDQEEYQKENAFRWAKLAQDAADAKAKSEADKGKVSDTARYNAFKVVANESRVLKDLARKAENSLLGKISTKVSGSEFTNHSELLTDAWSKAMSGAATGQLEQKMYDRMADPGFFNPLSQDYDTKMDNIISIAESNMRILDPKNAGGNPSLTTDSIPIKPASKPGIPSLAPRVR